MDGTDTALPPKPFLPAGVYWPDTAGFDLDQLKSIWAARGWPLMRRWRRWCSTALLINRVIPLQFAMITAMIDEGLAPLPLFVASLKDPFCANVLNDLLPQAGAQIILNMTSFAVSDPSTERDPDRSPGPFGILDCPVLQVMIASNTIENWQDGTAGLNPRDLAMHVVLPELDGRLTTRAVGFKARRAVMT